MTGTILEGHDIRVAYQGTTALEVAEIRVQEGEILSLIGPNGAGKSTLLRVLALLEAPTSGSLLFRGHPVSWKSRDLLSLRRRLACVFQEALLCDTTVDANAALGLRLRREPSGEVEAKVRRWLDRLGIAHLTGRRARTLSGGEAQRVSLARAFVLRPEVLLLDEPFAALDPPTRQELLGLLQDLLHQEGCATVFVTHDREEALRLGDRIAVMIDGRIQQIGRPPEVFGHPASEEVARFVGVETILEGRVTGRRDGLLSVDLDGARIEALGKAAVGERVLVCLRPEDLVIRRQGEPAAQESARNHLEGVIEDTTRLEAQYRLQVDCGPHVVALVTKESFEEMGLAPGRRVVVTFKASAVHLIRR
ncbi:MAG TPA: ABC transporter ATP-binding protein [Candidatus Methylomirabilis sp.]|nr:ABC transporter ATP-binding protein [Candidatus Methylomirabilis sp.]